MGAWPTIREGDRDSEESNGVYKVQRLLRHHGSDVTPDHDFGPTTATAVRDFQDGNGLDADGIVGAQTWQRMGRGPIIDPPQHLRDNGG